MTGNKITLAIESGIQGGSLSILDGTEEIDSWVGTKSVSRSEELLQEISALLLRNNIKKEDIELIAVSNAAGSYTGIRIGLATALGIRRATGCRIKGISVLEALARLAPEDGIYISAVSANGRDIYAQKFEKISGEIILEEAGAEILSYADFCMNVSAHKNLSGLFVNEVLEEILFKHKTVIKPGARSKKRDRNFFIKTGKNLAYLIGAKGQEYCDASDNVQQVYIREFR